MDICVWDKCNNRCLQCTNPDPPWPAWDGSFDYGYEALISRIRKDRKKFEEGDTIYLSGGEPTIHPRFADILEFLKTEFPEQRIKLLTNARVFSYAERAREAMTINDNFGIDVSLYGADHRTHDAVTRSPGSFRQTLTGLRNLLDHKSGRQRVNIRFIITGYSYRGITDIIRLVNDQLHRLGRLILIFWEIEAKAADNFDRLKLCYRDLLPVWQSVLDKNMDMKKLSLYHFPLCALPFPMWPHAWRTLSDGDVEFLPACAKCEYRQYCLGIPATYIEYVGPGEFQPPAQQVAISENPGNSYQPIGAINAQKGDKP